MRVIGIATAFTVLSSLLATSAQAQAVDQSRVAWRLHVKETVPLKENYRSYAVRERLQLLLVVDNKSTARVLIDQSRLRSAFGLRVSSGTSELPVAITWAPDVTVAQDDSRKVLTDLASPLIIESGASMGWSFTAERRDGLSFTAGTYVLTTSLSGFGTMLQTADGAKWRGRASDDGETVALVVMPPSNARERSVMHYVAAKEAEQRRDQEGALEEFRAATVADPTWHLAALTLAGTLVQLERHSEAAQAYDDILKRFASDADVVRTASFGSAFAQVSVGDEVGAAQTLRRTGMSEEQILAEIARDRGEVAARRRGAN